MNKDVLRNQKAGQDENSGTQISHLCRRYNTQTKVDLDSKAAFCQNQEASYVFLLGQEPIPGYNNGEQVSRYI